MARNFVAASSQYLNRTSTPVTAVPWTIAFWFRPASTAVVGSLAGVFNSGNTTDFISVRQNGATLLTSVSDSGAAGGPSSAGSLVAGTWSPVAFVSPTTSSRTIYINGGGPVSNSTTVVPSGLNAVTVGRRGWSSPDDYAGGDLAEVAIWNVALSALDVAILGSGLSPLLVRPDALVAYWPLGGDYSPEIELLGRLDLTVTGATKASHPPITRPSYARIWRSANLVLPAPELLHLTDGPVVPLLNPLQAASLTETLHLTDPAPAGQLAITPTEVLHISDGVGTDLKARLSTTIEALVAPETLHVRETVRSRRDLNLLALTVTVAGIDRTSSLLKNQSSADLILNSQPDAATLVFKTDGSWAPANGDAITINVQDVRLFTGQIGKTDRHRFRSSQSHPRYTCTCVDTTPMFDRRLVFAKMGAQSGTTMIQTLVAASSTGFTTNHVQLALPTVSMEFKAVPLSGCLDRICQAIGAAWYLDRDWDLHVWIGSDPAVTQPQDLDALNKLYWAFTYSADYLQVRTRVLVEGQGTTALACNANETILPIQTADMFADGGGYATVGAQRISYTGRRVGGAGTLVGPGVSPSSGPTVGPAAGSGIEDGVHQYAIVWGTAAGKSLPSPLTAATMGAITAPTYTPIRYDPGWNAGNLGGDFVIGNTFNHVFTYSTAASAIAFTDESAPSPAQGAQVLIASVSIGAPYVQVFKVQVQFTTDPTVKWVHWWRSVNGGPYLFRGYLANDGTTGIGIFTEGSISGDGIYLQTLPAARANQAALSNITVGPTGTTYREIYRTTTGGSQLKLQQTIANNTATVGVQDATPDASLGANAPTGDTSGLVQPVGQVNAGSTSILTAGAAAFSSTGGWAVIGNGQQVVRYTGVSGNTLTGVPASGAGAITATIAYNSTITDSPALVGIPASGAWSLANTVSASDAASLLVIVDDLTAQTILGAIEKDKNGVATDGIHEFYLQDGRYSIAGATSRAQAELTLGSRVIETETYSTRDVMTLPGTTPSIALPDYTGTPLVQSVHISWPTPSRKARLDVTCSSVSRDLYQVLRQIQAATEGAGG